MYLYDMVDKYTSRTISIKNNPGQSGNDDNCKSGQICIHNTASQAVDLETQPGFESVGNALNL